jgi:hypothetical protein
VSTDQEDGLDDDTDPQDDAGDGTQQEPSA